VVGRRTSRLTRVGMRLRRGARGLEVVEVAGRVSARIHRPPAGSRSPVAGVACDLVVVDGARHGSGGLEPRAEVSRGFVRVRRNAVREVRTGRI
jgi:hypothetical protein